MAKHITVSLIILLGTLALIACSSAEDSRLVTSAANGDIALVESSLENVSNINVTANDGWTALSVSSREGNIDVVKYLLDHGADINAQESGGNSPLFWAAFGGHVEIVRLLIGRGADTTRKCPKERARNRLNKRQIKQYS